MAYKKFIKSNEIYMVMRDHVILHKKLKYSHLSSKKPFIFCSVNELPRESGEENSLPVPLTDSIESLERRLADRLSDLRSSLPHSYS